jgi:hypothetical protein
MDRVCGQLQQLQPLDDRVLAALQEFHDGWQPPEVRGGGRDCASTAAAAVAAVASLPAALCA